MTHEPHPDPESVEDGVSVVMNGNVAVVTLCRPDSYNAIDRSMLRALIHSCERELPRMGAAAVVIRGSGRGFCAGQDLRELAMARMEPEFDVAGYVRTTFNRLVMAIRALETPTITAIHGSAVGAGLSVALACDLRVATPSAKLGQAFAKIGLVPDTGSTWLLPELIGISRAMEMTLTAEPISGERALEWGLVNRLAATDEAQAAMDSAMALAHELAELPTRTLGLAKHALYRSRRVTLAESLEFEAQLQRHAARSDEHAEALTAMLVGALMTTTEAPAPADLAGASAEQLQVLGRFAAAWAQGEHEAARLYAPLAMGASTPTLRLAFASIVRDELRHALVVGRLAQGLSVGGSPTNTGIAPSLLMPVGHVHHRQLDDEVDGFAMAFLLDRAHGHRLANLGNSTWAPLARTVRSMEHEELSHVAFGTHHMRRLARSRETRLQAQQALDRWFGPVANTFGVDEDPTFATLRELGLISQSVSDARDAFISEVRMLTQEWKLTVPKWSPPWQGQTPRIAAATAEHYQVIGG